jgi:hypothetical protein
MAMSHRQRLETAWSFREPDRVPIELEVPQQVRQDPRAARLAELADEHASNFVCVWAMLSGFLGVETNYHEEVMEDRAGEYKRIKRVHETAAGTFTAVTYHPADELDYHWEKRFISTLDDLRRIAEAPRAPLRVDADGWRKSESEIGEGGVPMVALFHPLGTLVRTSTMEEMYAWFYEEGELVHRFLAAAYEQATDAAARMLDAGAGPYFMTWAHEMFIPPWAGHRFFDEFVFPYDKPLADVIHKRGGKWRIHCHGRCMGFLEKFADMGIDAVEPLEHPPAGDVDLTEAKRVVGGRMMLSGNINSQWFWRMSPEQVREQVKEAVRVAAPGGGFSLRTSSAGPHLDCVFSDDQFERMLQNYEAYLLAGLEYGKYPIKGA